MMPTKRRRAFAVLLLALPVACGGDEEAKVVTAPPVTVQTVVSHTVQERIEATGQLVARAEATVAAQVAGEVTEIRVDEGSELEEGALILEIDAERRELELADQRAVVVEMEAKVKESQRDMKRANDLHKGGATSVAAVDDASTALRLAISRRDAARSRLGLGERAMRDATVRAPFGGFLARRHVSEGEFVQRGAPLFDLVALDPIEVEFFLPEGDSSRIEMGQRVQVYVAPFPSRIFIAHVTVIAPRIDSRTRTLRVKARIEDADGKLRPGLFARVHVGIATRSNVAMIPEDAVLQRADGTIVFKLLPENRVQRRRIVLGAHRDGQVEVVDGLQVGDALVVRGQNRLVEGSLVSLRNEDGTPVAGVSAPVAEEAIP